MPNLPKSSSKKAKASPQKHPRLHFITGNDPDEVLRIAQEKVQQLLPENHGGFGLETLEAKGESVEESLKLIKNSEEAIMTFPFFGGGKLVWLKNPPFLKDNAAGRSAAVQEELTRLGELLQGEWPATTRLLISAPEADKRRSFYKTFVKMANLTLCDRPDFGFQGNEYDVIRWVEIRAQQRATSLTPEAAELLAVRVGAESGSLEQELEKLSTAAGESKPITAELVKALVPQTRTGGIFDLSNAISQRDLPQALTTVKQLFEQGESAIGILLIAMVPTLRNLLLVKELMVNYNLQPPTKPFFFTSTLQKLPTRATDHLPRKKDGSLNTYPLGLAAMHANRFSLPELIAGFSGCSKLYEQFVTTAQSEEKLLELFLLKLLHQPS